MLSFAISLFFYEDEQVQRMYKRAPSSSAAPILRFYRALFYAPATLLLRACFTPPNPNALPQPELLQGERRSRGASTLAARMQAVAGNTITLSLPARRSAPRSQPVAASAPFRQASAGLSAKAVLGGPQRAALPSSSAAARAQRLQTRRARCPHMPCPPRHTADASCCTRSC